MEVPIESASRIEGDKLYHQRARKALPILVRQAEAAQTILYSELAAELEMPNPKNLNKVLGAIGDALKILSGKWKSEIPPIQCLVINKREGLPGAGVGWFLNLPESFALMSLPRKREIISARLSAIFAYDRWPEVLHALGLKSIPPNVKGMIRDASCFGGGGGSEDHRKLKERIANAPELLGLKPSTPRGTLEHALPSGDTLDVSFRSKPAWIAAEVKSARSPEADIVRGIFQCVKYLAVMRAVQTADGEERSARVILALGGALPRQLIALKNQLGVEVIDGLDSV